MNGLTLELASWCAILGMAIALLLGRQLGITARVASWARKRGVPTRTGRLTGESVARSFNAFASSWDRKHGPVGLRRMAFAIRRAHLRAICKELGRPRVLDVGCATGQHLLALVDQIGEGTGIDVSPAMIAQARLNARARGLDDRLRFEVAAAETACPDHFGRFDLVTCIGVLEHTVDPGVVLARIAGLLRPGGLLVLVIAYPWHPRSLYSRCAWRFGIMPPLRHLSRNALLQHAQAVGLYSTELPDLAECREQCVVERLFIRLLSSIIGVLTGSYFAIYNAVADKAPVAQVPRLGIPWMARLVRPSAILASVGSLVVVGQTVCA